MENVHLKLHHKANHDVSGAQQDRLQKIDRPVIRRKLATRYAITMHRSLVAEVAPAHNRVNRPGQHVSRGVNDRDRERSKWRIHPRNNTQNLRVTEMPTH